MGLRAILEESQEKRRELARDIDELLDPIMTAFGIVFLLLVLSERAVPEGSALGVAFQVALLVLWAAFILEFVVRLVIEPRRLAFLRKNWWQVPILVLPALRFLRLRRLLRIGRAGRLVTFAIRASRTANATLTNRVAWILTIHAIVILSSANLISDLMDRSFGLVLHGSALAATTGEPIPGSRGVVDVIEVVSQSIQSCSLPPWRGPSGAGTSTSGSRPGGGKITRLRFESQRRGLDRGWTSDFRGLAAMQK